MKLTCISCFTPFQIPSRCQGQPGQLKRQYKITMATDSQETWILTLTLDTFQLILGKIFKLLKPQCPHLQNGNVNSIYTRDYYENSDKACGMLGILLGKKQKCGNYTTDIQ